MHVIYSWDMNVIRAIPHKGQVQCVPLKLRGRNLKEYEIIEIAEKNWGPGCVKKFTYLGRGRGYVA